MKFGIFKARAVKDLVQYGESANGHPQMALVMRAKMDDGSVQEQTTFLIFSSDAAPYSFDRLRSLGWKGSDLTDLTGIDANEVDVRVFSEEYQGKAQIKCEIIGGGRVTLAKPMDPKSFAARVAAITGAPVAGGTIDKQRPPF
jgi:hypothetical protein